MPFLYACLAPAVLKLYSVPSGSLRVRECWVRFLTVPTMVCSFGAAEPLSFISVTVTPLVSVPSMVPSYKMVSLSPDSMFLQLTVAFERSKASSLLSPRVTTRVPDA